MPRTLIYSDETGLKIYVEDDDTYSFNPGVNADDSFDDIVAKNKRAHEVIDRIKKERQAQRLAIAWQTARNFDKKIQAVTKKIDKMAEAAVGALPKRQTSQPSFTCEVEGAVVKSSTALKTIHFGTLKIVYKVLPRELEDWLVSVVQKQIEKMGVKFAAKKILGKSLGSIWSGLIGIAVGSAATIDRMNALEQMIHDVLGCKPNKLESEPMRMQFGKIVEDIKERTASKSRPTGPVSTRNVKKK